MKHRIRKTLAAALSLSIVAGSANRVSAAEPSPAKKPEKAPAKAAAPKKEAKPEKPAPYELTDYGTFYSSTVVGKESTTNKAITIKVGHGDKAANVCFDTDLLRYSAGWTGGWLKLNHGRDGLEGPAQIAGDTAFTTKAGPGWAKDDNFKDPRQARRPAA